MVMLGRYCIDLHIHTCLSPCAELEMSPMNIAARATKVGLDMIAICDHNTAENAVAVMKAAGGSPVVLPGMEITSAEEVHIVGLFPTLESAIAAQNVVHANLPGENDEDAFGIQVIANENDEVVGFNSKLLIGATELSVEQVVDLIHEHGGLALAAHVDRPGFGIIDKLGFIPPKLPLDGLEVSLRAERELLEASINDFDDWAIVRSSDAHRLQDIGTAKTELIAAGVSFEELKMALHQQEGRETVAGV
jgi:PHP family Zn ribbon phosphoesterase